MNGRRWLAIDADLFGKRFTDDLYQQFGWAGVVTWIAYLCACKRSRFPGRFTFLNEADALAQMGLIGWETVDNDGKPWGLDDFWKFTGRKKQTRRTQRGRETNVTATHWGRWQQAATTSREAERKRTSRAIKRPGPVHERIDIDWTNGRPNKDLDSDTPLPPEGGRGCASNGNGETIDQNAVAELKAAMRGETPP